METIFVSIETTGLRKDDHELIQMTTLCGETTEVRNVKADKVDTIDANAMKYNGLDASKGMSRSEFSKEYGDSLKDKLVVIHCGKFTLKFLLDAGIVVGKFIDVMEDARARSIPLRLNALAKHFGVEGTKCQLLKGVYEAMND